MKLNLSSFFEKIDKLPRLYKILIMAGTVILLIGPFVYFSYLPKHKEIGELSEKLSDLESELLVAKRKADQIDEVRRQIAAAEEEFEEAKQALPESEEIPSLLTQISNAGQDSGLEFLLFKPENEVSKGFYAEIPVSIEVIGRYHDVTRFYNKLARLDRIVHVKDVVMDMAQRKKKKGADSATEDRLNVSCKAVTYKFLEQEPESDDKGKKKK
jgi:type IV pilus assembly protein PilO